VACLVSTVVNVIGDIWLVYFRGLGAVGAAAATAFAGAFSAIILLASVRSKTKHWKRLQDQQLQLNTQIPHDRRKIPFISLPTSTDFIHLAKLCGPIFIIMLAKLICYSAMTIKAADFGMLDMACHSIMLRIFYFFCTLGDSLSQAVQSYLPTLLFGKTIDGTKTETESMGISFLKRMFLLGGLFTIFNAFSSQFILQKLGFLFSTDVQILSLLQTPKYVVSVALGLGLHPIIMLLEGVLMAQGDLSFLMKSYGVSMSIMLGQIFMFSKNLGGVWFALVTFQVLRLLSFGLRVWDRRKAMATS
jgi:Na+-driven multidrug efflux pump